MQRIRSHRSRVISCVIYILLFCLFVLIDQAVKIYLKSANALGEWSDKVIIDGFFYFTYTTNSGAAWSFLSDKAWAQTFFKILTGVALVIFIWLFIMTTRKDKKLMRFSVVLLAAGAVGNFIDRLAYSFVVDFISFVFGSYHFPVFNIADALMTVGIILFIIDLLFVDESALFKRKKK